MGERPDAPRKPLIWIGSSKRDIRGFPEAVKEEVGFALYRAEMGAKHPSAKVLKGFGGAGVVEIVEDDDGKTYRVVYTVKFSTAVYVLHAFQKKSTQGIKTAKHDLDLVRDRLEQARQHHERQKPKK